MIDVETLADFQKHHHLGELALQKLALEAADPSNYQWLELQI